MFKSYKDWETYFKLKDEKQDDVNQEQMIKMSPQSEAKLHQLIVQGRQWERWRRKLKQMNKPTKPQPIQRSVLIPYNSITSMRTQSQWVRNADKALALPAYHQDTTAFFLCHAVIPSLIQKQLLLTRNQEETGFRHLLPPL